MQHEYKRDERYVGERFTLSHGGSSARMMRADEMDADLRQKIIRGHWKALMFRTTLWV